MRYKLDELGWFQFEKLVQALLKAELGLAVEAFGASSDHGRDAYYAHSLSYPNKEIEREGPFIFQVKFVESANAAGARPFVNLKKAVQAELSKIKKRTARGKWTSPSVYTLLTNSPITPTNRGKLTTLLSQSLVKSTIVLNDGTDVCGLLEQHPPLRRSFPEILSLRDLSVILLDVVNKDIIEQSASAIEDAREVVKIFVPTSAYYKARRALGKHHFVVLDGPPEMGKTAIARVLSIVQLLEAWQIVECYDPRDLFRSFDSRQKQLFVADDAFGRTEFDVSLGRRWERVLGQVLRRLDNAHWLVFTTRKHILERALRDMDLTGPAVVFPEPAEVVVETGDLSVEEKARILYRHAKVSCQSAAGRALVREHAKDIVLNIHFTPERIRRFVQEVLPTLEPAGPPDEIQRQVRSAIQNPTNRMRKAYRKLAPGHQWILIIMLEKSHRMPLTTLRDKYREVCTGVTHREAGERIRDLTGTFVRLVSPGFMETEESVDWIHPSYRDLVIDEVSRTARVQVEFLQVASVEGLRLACSSGGGEIGYLHFPFLKTEDSWKVFEQRCLETVRLANEYTMNAVIRMVLDALKGSDDSDGRERMISIVRNVAAEYAKRCLAGDLLSVGSAKSAVQLRSVTGIDVNFPIRFLWHAMEGSMEHEIYTGAVDADVLREWFELMDLVEKQFLSFARSREFRAARSSMFERLEDTLERDAEGIYDSNDADVIDSEAQRLTDLADVLVARDGVWGEERRFVDLAGRLETQSERLRAGIRHDWEPDEDWKRENLQTQLDMDEIWRIFSDL